MIFQIKIDSKTIQKNFNKTLKDNKEIGSLSGKKQKKSLKPKWKLGLQERFTLGLHSSKYIVVKQKDNDSFE